MAVDFGGCISCILPCALIALGAWSRIPSLPDFVHLRRAAVSFIPSSSGYLRPDLSIEVIVTATVAGTVNKPTRSSSSRLKPRLLDLDSVD